MKVDLSSVPVWLVAVAVALVLVQLTLDVVALVDLYRRPAAQVVGPNKLLWVAAIVLLNIAGPLLYLLIGRRRAHEEGVTGARSSVRPTDVADALYRRREERGQP